MRPGLWAAEKFCVSQFLRRDHPRMVLRQPAAEQGAQAVGRHRAIGMEPRVAEAIGARRPRLVLRRIAGNEEEPAVVELRIGGRRVVAEVLAAFHERQRLGVCRIAGRHFSRPQGGQREDRGRQVRLVQEFLGLARRGLPNWATTTPIPPARTCTQGRFSTR